MTAQMLVDIQLLSHRTGDEAIFQLIVTPLPAGGEPHLAARKREQPAVNLSLDDLFARKSGTIEYSAEDGIDDAGGVRCAVDVESCSRIAARERSRKVAIHQRIGRTVDEIPVTTGGAIDRQEPVM